jgi:protein involved in polysaccharide export with SLBB domain
MSISGAVARPGFYWASPDRPLSELIMMAGGPAIEANLRELEVRRSGTVVLTSKSSRDAMIRGYTIEQMDIRSGDEVRIPSKRKINWGSIMQLMFIVSSLFFAGLQFIQWYYSRQE